MPRGEQLAPRENCKIYNVLDGDEIIFTGSTREISKKFDVKYSNVYNYIYRHLRLMGKYKVVYSHTQHYLVEATDKETGEKIVGTAEDIGEIFYYSPQYVMDAVNSGRNLASAKLRKVEDNELNKTRENFFKKIN